MLNLVWGNLLLSCGVVVLLATAALQGYRFFQLAQRREPQHVTVAKDLLQTVLGWQEANKARPERATGLPPVLTPELINAVAGLLGAISSLPPGPLATLAMLIIGGVLAAGGGYVLAQRPF